jgi:hypothetical protein
VKRRPRRCTQTAFARSLERPNNNLGVQNACCELGNKGNGASLRLSHMSALSHEDFASKPPALSLFLRRSKRPGFAREAICFFLISPVAFTAVRELRFLRCAARRAPELNSRSISTQHPIAVAALGPCICLSGTAEGAEWRTGKRAGGRLIRAAQQITACRLARKTASELSRRPAAPLARCAS